MTVASDDSDVSEGTHPERANYKPRAEKWGIKQRLLYQLIVTEIISILGHGLNGHWTAGLFAPIWAACLPFAVYGPLSDAITRQMVIPAVVITILIIIIAFVLIKRIGAVWGHIALLLFNVISMLLLLTFK